ncbi:potassium-transporting ATPase subunit KdpC [Phenylobacterium sp. NIBR 498073]|uniref:potassium-transporting ATPase subunit KdpC n=1 Tax=Phenylobacterium sp. NIBR 498073 TaxID=3015177 RepID=UPI0022B4E38F|nr:potassium-transporting ATPase subunit KdpC [Phenylobacterium sp. NIBR 498073]MBS0489768.1 potassium-transporting ATPase subunit KdpC [Pseudomonadota bacterium]WGU42023.1 potassium-transporting ATPase subunit KdpC [Phenylobacterium sp. NIBR 498073]
MLSLIRPALVSMAFFTLLLGLAYPLLITGVGQAAFPKQANGSLVVEGGKVVGSELVGQNFAAPQYLHPRPSAAGADGYDAAASSGSNLGPLNPDLATQVAERAAALRAQGVNGTIPADAVTASASGLDPDVSPQYALLQADRIAKARRVDPGLVRALLQSHVEGRTFGVLGQPRVNVLMTNLALDARFPPPTR